MDTNHSNPTFRLSVWRPARHNRQLHYFSGTPDENAFEQSQLQELVYSWDPGQDDVFLCLEQQFSTRFHEELMDKFAAHLPPVDRSIQNFLKAAINLRSELQNLGAAEWVDSVEVVDLGVDGSPNLRMNTALSLVNHLYWLFKAFEHVPGASVVIR